MVHTLSEIEDSVEEFVIVLAFACGYDSLIKKVKGISKKHILLAPDVPVLGEGVFTKDYLLENFEKIKRVFNLLEDEQSKIVFKNTLMYKITGRIDYICDIATPPREAYENILKLNQDEIFVDVGAYNGDTVNEFIENVNGEYQKIYALEPDKRNFRKLVANTQSFKNIEIHNSAGWSEDATLTFTNTSGRQAMVAKNGVEIPARSIDSILKGEKATFIKYDVEGAENNSLKGSINTFKKYRPKLKVAIYHRNEDVFELPIMLKEINPDYKLFMRKSPYIPAWELNLFCV